MPDSDADVCDDETCDGSFAAFKRHKRAGTRICQASRAAYNAYHREYQRRRREPVG